MTAAFRLFYFCIVFIVYCFSLASAQDDNQFIFNGFARADQLNLSGAFVNHDGLLQLTDTFQLDKGQAFCRFPIKFNPSSSESFSFSTNFVFAIVAEVPNFGGQGMAFVISPSMDFSGAEIGSFLSLFSTSSNGRSENHILAVELDTVQTLQFEDIDGNHVGIDVNSLISNDSAPVTYFSDKEGKNISFYLDSGNVTQMWIDYNGAQQLLNVTVAPIGIPRPSRPLLSTSIDLSLILLDTMYVGFTAATGVRVSDHYILGWSFNKTGQAQNLDIKNLPSLAERDVGHISPNQSSDFPPLNRHTPSSINLPMIPVLVITTVIVLTTTVIVGGAVYAWRKKKYGEIYEDWEREYGPQRFSYKSLYKATKGFTDREIIGKGGFGKVYKGVLPSNLQIAVKRISHDSKQGMKEFIAEIVSMGKLRHRNLVQLRGYCRRRGELLLVYDYMPNGSLDKLLYNKKKSNLDWFQRFRILRGVASGLLYLHEDWEQVVLHRDIKPGNVLLDADLNGKLGDFGLARLHDHGSNPQTTKLVGTIGYMAPELPITGKASTSTDVYAFGVFMLELACGKRPMEQRGFVIDCWKRGAILDASDPRLEGIYVEDQMELVLKLGLFCSHSNPTARPSMRQVMQYLDGDAKLPDIPSDNVIDFFSATNQSSDLELFTPLLSSNSAQIMSTTDSILIEGR